VSTGTIDPSPGWQSANAAAGPATCDPCPVATSRYPNASRVTS